jgi:hypothetical protein
MGPATDEAENRPPHGAQQADSRRGVTSTAPTDLSRAFAPDGQATRRSGDAADDVSETGLGIGPIEPAGLDDRPEDRQPVIARALRPPSCASQCPLGASPFAPQSSVATAKTGAWRCRNGRGFRIVAAPAAEDRQRARGRIGLPHRRGQPLPAGLRKRSHHQSPRSRTQG